MLGFLNQNPESFLNSGFVKQTLKPWSRYVAPENIWRYNEAKDNRKMPLVRSPVWVGYRSVRPAADANTRWNSCQRTAGGLLVSCGVIRQSKAIDCQI